MNTEASNQWAMFAPAVFADTYVTLIVFYHPFSLPMHYHRHARRTPTVSRITNTNYHSNRFICVLGHYMGTKFYETAQSV